MIYNYQIENIKPYDYPEFCDAYVSYAEDKEGRPLTDYEIKKWEEDNPEQLLQLIHEAFTHDR